MAYISSREIGNVALRPARLEVGHYDSPAVQPPTSFETVTTWELGNSVTISYLCSRRYKTKESISTHYFGHRKLLKFSVLVYDEKHTQYLRL